MRNDNTWYDNDDVSNIMAHYTMFYNYNFNAIKCSGVLVYHRMAVPLQ